LEGEVTEAGENRRGAEDAEIAERKRKNVKYIPQFSLLSFSVPSVSSAPLRFIPGLVNLEVRDGR
jgi:hypothetical protein